MRRYGEDVYVHEDRVMETCVLLLLAQAIYMVVFSKLYDLFTKAE